MAEGRPYFAILGAMRTGSNLLERLINQYSGVTCLGEVFNPAFIGKSGQEELNGISMAEREADPVALLQSLFANNRDKVPGFRIFNGHDARITQKVLTDPDCKRVILRRNPIDSFISLKIARQTDQWMLGNVHKRKSAQVEFDPAEFETYHRRLSAYYAHLRETMQGAGLTAFQIDFSELKDLARINGLARFLGAAGPLKELEEPIKRQNPEPVAEKISNFADVRSYISDFVDTGEEPVTHTKLGKLLPGFAGCSQDKLLYTHVPGNPAAVHDWLTELGGNLDRFQNQKSISRWMEQHQGFGSFCVLSHPVDRAYRVFAERVFHGGPRSYGRIRRRLSKHFGVRLAEDCQATPSQITASFEAFCAFLKANVAGQTGIRVDDEWAPQDGLVATISEFVPIRRIMMHAEFADFAADHGPNGAFTADLQPKGMPPLSEIFSQRIENLVQATYARDFRKFGFGPWSGGL